MSTVLELSDATHYYNAYAMFGDTTCNVSSDPDADDPVVCCNGVELVLGRNATQYTAYHVTAPDAPTFNLSASFIASDVTGVMSVSIVYLQPWDSYPAAASSLSQSVPVMTGSVQLSGIKDDNYAVLTSGIPVLDASPYGYSLVQSSLTDEGKLFGKSHCLCQSVDACQRPSASARRSVVQVVPSGILVCVCRHFGGQLVHWK